MRLRIGALAAIAAWLLATACGSSSQTETLPGPSAVKCTLQVQAQSAAFPPAGGSGTLRVATNRDCQWSAKSDASWVTLASGEGQGEGSLQFTVAPNADPSPRSTGITVNDQRVQISQDARPCEFTLSSNRETVEGPGGDGTIQVKASSTQCTWTAAASAPWITITSGREGRGNGTVAFHVDAGTGPPRTGTITVAGQTVQIEQGTGCSYSIPFDAVTMEPSGGDGQVVVSAPAGCAWTAESQTAWITIKTGSTGTGAGVVTFHVAATTGAARAGTLIVAGRTVTVTQSACAFSISPTSLNVNAQSGSATIRVDTAAGCAWSAAPDAAWLTVSGAASGSGPGQLQLAIAANTGPERTGSVVIAGQKVTIVQANGCTYSVSPSAQDISSTGGSSAATVTTGNGCTWRATSSADWITFATASGTGSGQAAFTVATNQGPPRSATLTIAGQTLTVRQASACTWTFAPPSHEFDSAGGNGNVLVLVTGLCTWTAESTVNWIRITEGSSGTGSGLLQFTAAPNTGPARTGTIVIAAQDYIVRQAGQ